MRVVIQRVQEASVHIDHQIKSKIHKGLLILLGIESRDSQEDIDWLCKKILNLRIFPDDDNVMNKSVKEAAGSILVVSQFTLHASIKKGNRPSYIKAAQPAIAIPLYEQFIESLKKNHDNVQTGIFGANMQIQLINDGPVTILMDTHNKE